MEQKIQKNKTAKSVKDTKKRVCFTFLRQKEQRGGIQRKT